MECLVLDDDIDIDSDVGIRLRLSALGFIRAAGVGDWGFTAARHSSNTGLAIWNDSLPSSVRGPMASYFPPPRQPDLESYSEKAEGVLLRFHAHERGFASPPRIHTRQVIHEHKYRRQDHPNECFILLAKCLV